VISWPTTLGVDPVLQPAEARELFAGYNDDLAALVHQHPQRLSGLAALTTSDIAWSARELERAHRELGLIGAVLPAGAFLNLEGARHLAPIFDVAERLGSHIYLHTGLAHPDIPGQWAHPSASDSSHARWLLESTSQFAAAWITLGLSPFLDAYPNVSVQLAMLGGVLPLLLGSLDEQDAAAAGVRRLYIDSAIIGTDPDALALAIRHLGAERILFGSDYPLQSSVQVLQALRDNGLAATEQVLASGTHLLHHLREKQRP
jgi:predicted TIM-barrel fold metal-dependent hydrolase